MKKILIDAYQYTPVITGTDRMGHNFLRELQKLDHTNQYVVICSAEPYIPSSITNKNFTILRPPRAPSQRSQRLLSRAWRATLPTQLKRQRADTFYSFHNMRLPRSRVAPRMLTSNLDLIPLKLGAYKNLSTALLKIIQHGAKAADGFVSISEYSKRELCDLLHVDPAKITVIPLAADPLFDGKSRELPKDLPRQFILTMGGSEPRKNVATVSAAFSRLPEQLQSAYPLLIVGGSWHGHSLKPMTMHSKHIRALGAVDDPTLVSLFANTTAFIFASTYEGFGFSILEAMSFGAPVLSATGSSLDEVTGDAALTFKPQDVATLARELERVLTDKSLRQKLHTAGKKRASMFSWEKSAQALHKLLLDE